MSYPISLLTNPPAPTYPEYAELYETARRTVPRFAARHAGGRGTTA